MRSLTQKQQAFINAYIGEANGNGTQAARLAGYKGSDDTLRSVARENLTKPHIAAEIERRQQAARERAGLTLDWLVERLMRIADVNIADFGVWQGAWFRLHDSTTVPRELAYAISEVREGKHGIAVKFHSKTQALEMLGRHLGAFKDRVQHDVKTDATVYYYSAEGDRRSA